MAVVIINPNSTVAMTEAMVAAAQAAAPGLTFEGWTSHDGPPAIQGPEDGARAEGPLLTLVEKADGADGIIVGCFDDTALAAAAKAAACPVIGIGQASFHLAALQHWRFSVVTTLDVSVPIIERNIREMGLDWACARVRAADVPVLALESDRGAAERAIRVEAERALTSDGCDALILGCAGMVHVTHALRADLDTIVIDPVEAAATGMRWLLTRSQCDVLPAPSMGAARAGSVS